MTPRKAKPAGASGGHRTITVDNWKPLLTNGCLRGFFSVRLPNGIIIHNCHLIDSGGRRWVGLPSRRFKLSDGRIHYEPVIEFASRKALIHFRSQALESLEQHLDGRGHAAC